MLELWFRQFVDHPAAAQSAAADGRGARERTAASEAA
jgi:hypothetical protein